MRIISANEAAALIPDGALLVPGGFGSCGHPDALTRAVREHFLQQGHPRDLSLLFGPGPGDKAGRGVDALALPGLVRRAIGGFWGLCPALARMAIAGELEAHNWPQGVISKLYSAIASGEPGLVSRIGMDTFVDPDLEGGVLGGGASSLVQKLSLAGKPYLFYPSQRVDVALLRGTASDADGNISFCEETSYMDALAQAQAARNSGGIVIVQVKRLLDGPAPARAVRIPAVLVDYVVLADEADHPQTYGCAHHPGYTATIGAAIASPDKPLALAKRIIATRAALELRQHQGQHVNLGIGVPALVGARAAALGLSGFHLSVESGLIGGIPDEGLSFGAALYPRAVIEQSSLFDWYDGGGIDVALLGFAEVDGAGNVNVSKFGPRVPGAGGFINISQTARKVVFCGTFSTGGLEVAINDGRLDIVREGAVSKFCQQVGQMTFNGAAASAQGKTVLFITERAVFRLREGALELCEIAPGFSAADITGALDCPVRVAPDLIRMPGFDLLQP